MDIIDAIYYASLAGGFFMAFALGSNDVANSMASAVGARAITIRQAVCIAAILNFLGAVFMGAHVTATISKGIVNPSYFQDANVLAMGMFSTLLAAGLFVLLSTVFSLPVSSTHAVIGALIGFGLLEQGPEAVEWAKLIDVVLSWILTPVLALGLAYGLVRAIGRVMLRPGETVQRIKRYGPVLLGLTTALVTSAFVLENPLGQSLKAEPWEDVLVVAGAGCIVWLLSYRVMAGIAPSGDSEHDFAEALFRKLQVFTSAYVALAHGSNDVANALGPVAAIYMLTKAGSAAAGVDMPVYILVVGGFGIALGIGLLGHRVIKTVGEKITQLDNVRGFSADFSIATTVMVSSNLGLPVSSTHVAVGAVTGVGLSQGRGRVQFGLLGKIFVNWVITLPIAAGVCMAIHWVLRGLVG